MSSGLIFNDDKPGNWIVTVIAEKNMVNHFQCRSRESAVTMAQRIWDDRKGRRLSTDHFTLCQLSGFTYTGQGKRKRRVWVTTEKEIIQL